MASSPTPTRRAAAAKPKAEQPPRAESPARAARVILDVDCDDARLYLVLANIGSEIALDVKVRFTPDLRGLGGEAVISDLRIFRGLGLLRPGKQVRIFWDSAPLLFARRGGTKFVADLTWRDEHGSKHASTYKHDAGVYRDLPVDLLRRSIDAS